MHPLASIIAACVALTFQSLSPLWLLPHRRPWWKVAGYQNLPSYDGTDDDDAEAEDNVYADRDGKATPASMRQARDLPQRFLIVLSSVASAAWILVLTWMLDLFGALGLLLHMLIVAGWIIIAVEAIFLACTSTPSLRYGLGINIAVSSLVLLGALLLRIVDFDFTYGQSLHLSLQKDCAIYVCLALFNTLIALSFHRRPNVFRAGRSVDGQFSTTALGQVSFYWVTGLIKLGHSKSRLDEEDLPHLDVGLRSEHLRKQLEDRAKNAMGSFWLLLFREHASVIAQQWILAVCEAFVMFGPQYAMFQLLDSLERRQSSHHSSQAQIWLWVFVLGLTSILQTGLAEWLEWIGWSRLELGVIAQLNATIFSKALRMEDIKDDSDSADTKEETEGAAPMRHTSFNEETPLLRTNSRRSTTSAQQGTHELPPTLDDDSDSSSEDESEDGHRPRGVINLLDVDAERISASCTELSQVLSHLVKLAIGVTFLVSILGWPSTLAGISIPLLFAPITKWVTSSYTGVSTRVSKARDRKTNTVSEALHSMRQVKFGALEQRWQRLIMATRTQELTLLRKLLWWSIALTCVFLTMPVVLGATALSVYSLTHGRLPASVAFTSLAVFSGLEHSLSYLPALFAQFADTYVSMKRINEFFSRPDKVNYVREGENISMKSADISWPTRSNDEDVFTLQNINLDFPIHGLSIILGKTGSGKSLLLASIVGEARLTSGFVFAPQPSSQHRMWEVSSLDEDDWEIPTAKAFVSQIPWIENASFKDNILYGLPFNHNRYQRVIHACTLEQDLAILQDGDNTEVGASGVNLSGGQKWRLTLARALYSRAGILILDDIFSAVDSHVGLHILNHALLGDLGKSRTIILATHHADLVLPVAHYVVEINSRDSITAKHYPDRSQRPAQQQASPAPREAPSKEAEVTAAPPPRKFVEEEHRAEGSVALSVYRSYYRASGGWRFWLLVLTLFALSGAISLARSYWVKWFTERNSKDILDSAAQPNESIGLFIGVYVALSAASILSLAVNFMVVRFGMLRAGKVLFEQVLQSVLKAPLSWIDTIPVGRALNRFVGDFTTIDAHVATWIAYSFQEFFILFTILVAALLLSPYTIAIIIPLLLAIIAITWRYLAPARDLKRINSVNESPILDLVGVTLSGLATIRTFDKAGIYMSRFCTLVDTKTRANYHMNLLQAWIGSRLGLLSSFFEIGIAVFVAMNPNISAATAGFALSFALEFSDQMIELVMDCSRLELDMNAVERVVEYTQLPEETQDGKAAPASWPAKGQVEVRNLKVAYAPDLPPALQDVSFSIKPQEHVGVVGRTGSGKSTLTLSFFRFLDALEGSIHIDDVDISTVKLKDLRSRLSIIPQDPTLFTGTVRSNLDPFNRFTDARLFAALKQVSLVDPTEHERERDESQNKNIFLDLHSPISKSGLNISQGQRQLMCLARALLGDPRVMLLDEATSAVDMETDTLIQRSIREGFAQTTLIVIAHRLSTVIDLDKILVMGEGKVLEFGAPLEVFRRGGVFTRMVEESGERERLVGMMEGKAGGVGMFCGLLW